MNPDWKGKRVLVMGLGLHGGGVGTVEFLVKCGVKVTVTDLRTRRELASSLKALAKYRGIRYVLGRHRLADFRNTDLIVKNPGVRRDSPYLKEATQRGIPITSDIGIFFQLCPAKIIGITGTRGKSTTTYLVWKFLKTKFRRVHPVRSKTLKASADARAHRTSNGVHYGGNIRRSVFEILPRIRKNDLVVLELSSFQLQDLAYEKRSPHIAVFTNILKDHLNWHRSMKEYIEAKSAIFRFQGRDDTLFINRNDPLLRRMTRRAPSRARGAALPRTLEKIVDRNLGEHYRPSVALAAAVAHHFGVGLPAIRNTLRAFRGLEARLEEIATIKGVHFINDTTATIPDAAIAAMARFRKLAGRHHLILIAGGQDKKLDFTRMAAAIRKSVDHLILLPGTATQKLLHAVGNARAGLGSVHKVGSMKDAVGAAYGIAQRDDYIVLSPGAASFGLFLNEFYRGQQFVDEVRRLKTLNPKP